MILHIIQNTVFKTSPLNSTQLSSAQKVSISKGQSFSIQSAQLKGKHYLVQLQQNLLPVGYSGYLFADHVRIENSIYLDDTDTGTEQPVLHNRGVWLTNVDSQALASHKNIKAAVQRLADLNFNTLYPVVWNRGYTLYPSLVSEQITGSSTMPQSQFQQRDMLAELLHEAKAHRMRVIPWFEYGLMAPPHSALAEQHPDWLTQKLNGETRHNQMVWLNPVHPDVVQFMTDLIQETVRNYDIDGIQLDDHFGMPVELGYDTFTTAQYRQKSGVNPPIKYADPAWMAWRAAHVTQLMQQISCAVKAVKPGCLVSLSPNPQGFSFNHYLADWQRWERGGLVDELVVQLYRSKLAEFEAELLKPELISARCHIPVSIGILSGLKHRPVSLEQIQQQVAVARKHQYAGVSFFFYETVINQTLSPRSLGDRDPLKLKTWLA